MPQTLPGYFVLLGNLLLLYGLLARTMSIEMDQYDSAT